MKPDQLPDEMPQRTSSVDESRRRFTKSGVAASGVLLTLGSRPVMAIGQRDGKCCQAPSAWGSINASTYGPQPVCQGKPPSHWEDCAKDWPVKCDDHKFHRYFRCSSRFKYYDDTMLEVCKKKKNDYSQDGELCSRLVAAYLNAKQGWTPFLKEETVKAMFSECFGRGWFEPTAGVKWSKGDCINYLKATQET